MVFRMVDAGKTVKSGELRGCLASNRFLYFTINDTILQDGLCMF